MPSGGTRRQWPEDERKRRRKRSKKSPPRLMLLDSQRRATSYTALEQSVSDPSPPKPQSREINWPESKHLPLHQSTRSIKRVRRSRQSKAKQSKSILSITPRQKSALGLQVGKLSPPRDSFTARIHRSMPDTLAPRDQTPPPPLLRYHVTRNLLVAVCFRSGDVLDWVLRKVPAVSVVEPVCM